MNDYKIKELMEEMELELISSMKRNLSRHLKEEDKVGFEFPQWQAMKLKELKKYQRENKEIIDNYSKGLDKDISNHLKEELTQGSKNSIQQYNKILDKNVKPSKIMNNSFFKTNDRKVNMLIKTVNNDLKTVNTSALRMINDEYRQVIHKSAFFLANGTISPKKAIDMATKEFLSRGLNCIEYKDGKRVNIASYSEMAVRTASLRAQLMGDGDFRESIGRHLVIATTSNAACPLCSKWENKVMIDDVYSGGSQKDGDYPLLSDAMKQGFLHPNCRDGVGTYYPELEDIDKSYENGKDGSESDEAYQEDLNYINQRIKQFTRLEIGSLDEDNIKKYHNQRIAYDKKRDTLVVKQELTYQDVTKEWKDKSKPNIGNIVIDDYFMTDDGIKHPIKGQEKIAVADVNSNEYKMAKILKKVFGGNIHLVPRIEQEKGYKGIVKVSTPDFRWNGEKWDLKTPGLDGKFENTLERFLKKKGAKQQSKKYIIDYGKFSNKSDEEIIEVIENTLKNRNWVEDLIVIRNDKILKIYSKIK